MQVLDSSGSHAQYGGLGGLATEVLIVKASVEVKIQNPRGKFPMAIEKKSLIKNRTATKKALAAKPEKSAEPSVKVAPVNRVHPPTRVATGSLHRVKF
jgi:hypothetical protein